MSASETPSDPSASRPEPGPTAIYKPQDTAAELVQVLDEYLSDLQAGRNPDKARLLAEHPELAQQLEECLAGIEFVHRAAKPAVGNPTQLGDFRIVREVGRGGMGVVYEAEQLSLKRKVALKVLRFGITADAEVMQRFQREAETVAHLHHTNIVPIHAIGCEEGVHFYAMQFIEGRSLAAVLAETQQDSAAADASRFRETAEWALQAADALAYAHQRGVIHRDVKPSNLILDPEGTVWLTDFGLAKRADEVTMTAAGVVMGTPRYMSPEQAAAAKQPIDHRTDIYSLGATLYELATGKPVFESPTPQGVITQILNAEPIAPRLVQGKLPRDLETIILKCLAKEPSKRYQQARDLADDLRAYLENRPIRARRASIAERVTRWAKKHRRSTAVSAVSVAASVLLVCGGIAAWNAYQKSLQGQLVLTTEGPSLVAEVLNEHDELVVPSFPVPTPQAVEVPAGSYRVRLSAPGTLSEIWQMDVERGKQTSYPVALIDRTLAPPLEIRRSEPPQLIELEGRQHIFHRGEQGWRLSRGATLQSAWPKDLGKFPEKPEDAVHPQTAVWNAWQDLLQLDNYAGQTGLVPGLAPTAADVNQDQHDDLILASRVSPSLIAVSGVDGRVLWWYRASPPIPREHDLQQDPLDLKATSEDAGVIGRPVLVNLNGEPIVVAAFVSSRSDVRTQSGKSFHTDRQFYVEGVAARSGKQVWRALLNFEDFPNVHLNEVLRVFPQQPEILDVGGQLTVLMPVHTKIHGFNLATGKEAWPARELGAQPVQPPRFCDVNGDRNPAAMIVLPVTQARDQVIVKVLSLATGTALWNRQVRTTDHLDSSFHETSATDIAWVADLDQDGKSEVIVPNTDNWEDGISRHWYGIEVHEGATGNVRWERRLWTSTHSFSSSGASNGMVRILLGPDLNGDGYREVFTSSTSIQAGDGKQGLRISCLSGRDGKIVWRQEVSGSFSPFKRNGQMRWWQVGNDGWPQLIVPLEKWTSQQPATYVYAASTGHLDGILPEIGAPHVADLNTDGIPDIYHLNDSQGSHRLVALKGITPIGWRRPGQWKVGQDYDGDGTTDFLKYNPHVQPVTLGAFSGRDLRPLWKSPLAHVNSENTLLTSADVNGDGVSDIVGLEQNHAPSGTTTLAGAASGKDGRRLWSAFNLGQFIGSNSCTGGGAWCNYRYPFVDQCDLNHDGRPEILVAANLDGNNLLSLGALSNADGSLLWKVPILAGSYTGRSPIDRDIWHDLNGDRVLDIVLLGPEKINKDGTSGGIKAMAYSGQDGRPLWKESGQLGQTWFLWPRPAIGDLDGDGAPEVVLTTNNGKGWDSAAGGYPCDLVVLDGATGTRKWNWQWTSGTLDVLPPLLVNLRGDGQRLICMGVQENSPSASQSNLVIFSPGGEVLKRYPIEWVNSNQPWMALDLDGDQQGELIYFSKSELAARKGLDQQIVWKRPATFNSCTLGEFRAGPQIDTSTLVLWEGSTMLGVNPANGTTRWRCDIPKVDAFSPAPTFAFSTSAIEPPLVATYGAQSQSTLTQHAWQTTPTGAYQSPAAKFVSFTEYAEPVRWRPLPWSFRMGLVELLIGMIFFVPLGLAVCRGQWRRVLVSLVLLGLVSVGIGTLILTLAGPLQEGEQYSWDGWYWILLIGGCIMGAITGVWGVMRFLIRQFIPSRWFAR